MKRSTWAGPALGALLCLLLTAPPVPADKGDTRHSAEGSRPVPEGWCGTGTGGLHVVSGGEIRQQEFPLKHTKVDAEVSGPVARVEVTQTFQNPYDETIEAIYVFPLPHEAAVNNLEMRLGERVIRGLIERRAEARRIYEEARDRGHVAALLEEERPNIFTQSVANILPGNEIEIKLTYVEMLDYEKSRYEFVFPMVVGPRFIPPGGGDVVPAGGFAPVPRTGVPDADRITPPVLPPEIRSGHDIEVNVRLDAGLPMRKLESRTHVTRIDREGTRKATVMLSPLDTIPNKDFVLAWRIESDAPEIGVLAHHDGEDGYVTVMLHPKLDPRESEITAKEMVFVLDCSGSMRGEPMAASKALVRNALRNLRSGDTFQIIRFSTSASGFSGRPVAATPGEVKRGIAYVDQLAGGGGTMMVEGIKAALDYPHDPDRLRIVMFLTDGYIGNEAEILDAVSRKVGSARLFSFGVGSSVNRYLLDRMAEEGRGEVQYFLPGSDVQEDVAKFIDRIRSPYLTDIRLAWSGIEVDGAYPARVPDLFAGRPLVVHGRFEDGGRGALHVEGRVAGRAWEKRIPLDLPRNRSGNPALGALWARARVADLERSMVRGEDADTVERITQLGLSHRLVTKYTSFVAVEETIVVSDGAPKTVRVPVEMPEGVSYEGVFGGRARIPGAEMAWRGGGGPMMKKSMVAHEQLRALGFLSSAPAAQEEDRARRDAPAPEPRDERAAAAMTAVQIRLSCDATMVRQGDKIRLKIEVTNGSRYAVPLPAYLLADDGAIPALRVIDTSWSVATLPGASKPGTETAALEAGATRTRTIELDTTDARLFSGPGIYHVLVEGAPFGARDSNRITVRIVGT